MASDPYADPDVDLNGEVVFWGAHFDAADPTGGVGGSQVLLGEARFEILAGAPPPTSLALNLSFAGTRGYKNFVTTDGLVLDDEPGGVLFVPEPGAWSGTVSGALLLAAIRRRAARRWRESCRPRNHQSGYEPGIKCVVARP
jgi:hypothetical protein